MHTAKRIIVANVGVQRFNIKRLIFLSEPENKLMACEHLWHERNHGRELSK